MDHLFSSLQPLWLPKETMSDSEGREITVTSLLGPFLSPTVFAEEDPSVAEKHFSGKTNSAAVRAIAQELQADLDIYRVRKGMMYFLRVYIFDCRVFLF